MLRCNFHLNASIAPNIRQKAQIVQIIFGKYKLRFVFRVRTHENQPYQVKYLGEISFSLEQPPTILGTHSCSLNSAYIDICSLTHILNLVEMLQLVRMLSFYIES